MNKSIFTLIILSFSISFFLNSCNLNPNNSENNTVEKSKIKNQKPEFNPQEYLKKGKTIALATKDALGKQLISAINSKGTDQALEFCNIKAMPLTDSMSTNLNVKIKRVSDKYRNPENKANEQELQYILQAKSEIENHGSTKPKLFEENNKVIGYYPITTNALCLQCHGYFETDINEKTQLAIQKNYPNDLATGYTVNELRGIWVIEMNQ